MQGVQLFQTEQHSLCSFLTPIPFPFYTEAQFTVFCTFSINCLKLQDNITIKHLWIINYLDRQLIINTIIVRNKVIISKSQTSFNRSAQHFTLAYHAIALFKLQFQQIEPDIPGHIVKGLEEHLYNSGSTHFTSTQPYTPTNRDLLFVQHVHLIHAPTASLVSLVLTHQIPVLAHPSKQHVGYSLEHSTCSTQLEAPQPQTVFSCRTASTKLNFFC